MEIVIGWIIFSCIAGAIANNKGNSFAGAFLISLLLSPIIGIVIALVQRPNEAVIESKKLQEGASVKCPFCAELIKKEAVVCRFCGKTISSFSKPSQHAIAAAVPPQSPRQTSSACIYLFFGNEVKGPYTTTEVEQLIQKGNITLETLCCVEPSKEWQPLANLASEKNGNDSSSNK